MGKYNGNTELISGLKQKNNGNFPLMEASAIQVDDEGTRLDEKLKKLEDTSEIVNDVLASETVSKIQANISSLQSGLDANTKEISDIGTEVSNLSGKIDDLDIKGNEYDISYQDNILTLLENDEVKTQVTIAGGGGTGESTTITIDRITPSTAVALLGDDVIIKYKFTSVDSVGDDTGTATATWTVGGRTVAIEIINQGENSFNLKEYLSAGNNDVKISITDSAGSIATKRWTINAIDMYITSTFNDTQVYDGDVVFRYSPYGDIEKTVHFVLDDEELPTVIVSTSGRQQSITISHKPHGSHSLKVYCTALINDVTITSNTLYFDIMFIDEGNSTPIIRCAYDGSNASQYTAKVIKYSVYTPGNLTSNVSLSIDDNIVSSLVVDRTEQSWNYKPNDFGEKVLKITCGSVEKVLNVTVDKFPYEISQVTDGLEFDFNPNGRSNSDENYTDYQYGDYKMSVSDNFDWQNGGWKVDSDGNSYFCVKAGTTMTLDYPLFGSDAKTSGKDFKFIYKATLCKDFNAKVMECLVKNIGVQVNAQNAILSAGGTTLDVPYIEDKYMELEFNIQPSSTYSEMMALIDADPSKIAVYSETDNFDQRSLNNGEFVPIVFGSDDCDVWIYRFKAYNKHLNDDEIMDNRIADAPDSAEMANRYLRNLIVNAQGEVDYDLISKVCPDLRVILITCPRFTKGKKDKVAGCTVQHIYTKGGAKHNWTAENVTLSGQGTSSDNYGDSSRNMDIDCTKTVFKFSDNTESSVYSMTDNSIGEAYFNIKVNVASSENANNSRFQDDYHTYQPYLREARQKDSRVRDTMEFHPCVIFVQETDTGEATQFSDGKMHFYSCGDFGNSKKNHTALGMETDNPLECIVEIDNNTDVICRFKSDDLSEETWDGKHAIEFRYPSIDSLEESVVNILKANVQRLWTWVVSTDADAATNRALNETELKDVAKWGKTYTTDSAEYRLDKFKYQFEDYFIKDSILYHYLFTERHCMVDNRAKNVFIHTSDGLHWDAIFDYDNDTADGNDNEGGLTLEYGLEDIDKIGDRDVFNAADSVLWVNVRKTMFNDLRTLYLDRESAGAWSASRIIQKFYDYQWVKPERLELVDMRRKYIRPYETKTYDYEIPVNSTQAYLPMLYGRKEHQRNRFETYEEKYIASKYTGGVATQDVATLRAYARGDIKVTPYADMYVNIKAGSLEFNQRAKKGEEVTFSLPSDAILNDTETYIYTSSLIQKVGDLSALRPGYCNFSMASKLQRLPIGSGDSSYSNSNLTNLDLKSNELLEYLDIRNCPKFSMALNLTNCTRLKEIYTTGTNCSGVVFATNGLLEIAELNAIQSLIVKKLGYVKKLFLESYDNVNSLVYESCPSIDSLDLVKKCINLSRIRATGIDWLLANTDLLNNIYKMTGIDENNSNTNKSVLAGSVTVPAIRQQELDRYTAAWTNLKINYEDMVTQYTVTFKNWDDTVLTTVFVDAGESCEDPIESGLINTPTKEKDVQYTYTFREWDVNLSNPVLTNITVKALYDSEIRKYTVRWLDELNQAWKIVTVDYGTSVEYDKENPTRAASGMTYYLFDGWDKATTFIDRDLDVKAKWQSGIIPAIGQVETYELTPAQIYGLVDKDYIPNYFEDADYINVQMGYMPTFTNIEEQVLVSEPYILNGTSTYINTGIKLFDEDRSFTIAFDFTMGYKASGKGTILSCYNEYSTSDLTVGGFTLSSTNNSVPTFKWGPNASQTINSYKPTEDNQYREMCVIRHIKGDNNIYLYTNDRFTTNDVVETILKHTLQTSIPNVLSIGAEIEYNGTKIKNYATGTVNYAKIWFGDLGEEECRKICSWTYGLHKFEYCGTERYEVVGAARYSSGSFVAKELLDGLYPIHSNSNNTGGWNTSDMREWLNKKMYAAVDPLWKQLIKQVQIKSIRGGSYSESDETKSEILTSSDYLYIPSIAEVDSTYNKSPYSLEKKEEDGPYSMFTNDASRIKYIINTETPNFYYLRTPSLTDSSYNAHVTSKGKTGLRYNQDETVDMWNTTSTPGGILVAFSI